MQHTCTRARICMPSDSDTLPKANEGKAKQGRQGSARQKASLGNGTDSDSYCEMRSRTQDSDLRTRRPVPVVVVVVVAGTGLHFSQLLICLAC